MQAVFPPYFHVGSEGTRQHHANPTPCPTERFGHLHVGPRAVAYIHMVNVVINGGFEVVAYHSGIRQVLAGPVHTAIKKLTMVWSRISSAAAIKTRCAVRNCIFRLLCLLDIDISS